MFKTVAVSYPKRRKKKHERVVNEIQEPVRKTMYDVVIENFHSLKRVTYIHRVIYVGEHSFDKDGNDLENLFRSTVDAVNESYAPEKLTGLLLCYAKYFIHLIEGDEDSINKHLSLLLNSNLRATHLGTIKLLIHVSHVSRRIMDKWKTYPGVPAQYLGKINIDSSLQESSRHVYNCIRKMYSLVFYLNESYKSDLVRNSLYEVEETPFDHSVSISGRTKFDIRPSNLSLRPGQLTGASSFDPYRSSLPEYEIVDFTIKTSLTEDLSKYHAIYGVVPQRLIYKDRIWPCPTHYVPYDVFSKPYDTITELPKPAKEEDAENVELTDETADAGAAK